MAARFFSTPFQPYVYQLFSEPAGICDGISDIRWGCAGLAGDGEVTGQVDYETSCFFAAGTEQNSYPKWCFQIQKLCYVAADYEVELRKDTHGSCEVDGEGWFTLSEERFKTAEILFQPQIGGTYRNKHRLPYFVIAGFQVVRKKGSIDALHDQVRFTPVLMAESLTSQSNADEEEQRDATEGTSKNSSPDIVKIQESHPSPPSSTPAMTTLAHRHSDEDKGKKLNELSTKDTSQKKVIRRRCIRQYLQAVQLI